MVRQAKNASKDAELKAPKKKKEESERRSAVFCHKKSVLKGRNLPLIQFG